MKKVLKLIFSLLCCVIWFTAFDSIKLNFPAGSKGYINCYIILFGVTAVIGMFQIRRKMKNYL